MRTGKLAKAEVFLAEAYREQRAVTGVVVREAVNTPRKAFVAAGRKSPDLVVVAVEHHRKELSGFVDLNFVDLDDQLTEQNLIGAAFPNKKSCRNSSGIRQGEGEHIVLKALGHLGETTAGNHICAEVFDELIRIRRYVVGPQLMDFVVAVNQIRVCSAPNHVRPIHQPT